MNKNTIINEYFSWLYYLVYNQAVPYTKLLTKLHATEFTYTVKMDRNRAKDGEALRTKFSRYKCGEISDEILEYLDGPCSVLEMIVALALRCEETIMDDPAYGNRTGQWFWSMIKNMGLGSMYDDNYDRDYVEQTVTNFLDRNYEPDGTGGLFKIRHCREDLRNVQIWAQLNWYLDTIV